MLGSMLPLICLLVVGKVARVVAARGVARCIGCRLKRRLGSPLHTLR
jgi:hypothetical protein